MDSSVFGLLSQAEAVDLIEKIRAANDPGTNVPDVPWAVCTQRPDGSTVLACSPMLVSGVFYALSPVGPSRARTLVVATDPGAVVEAADWPWRLDGPWLQAFARDDADPSGSPYHGMRRLLPGQTAVIDGRHAITIHTWCGRQAWGEPDLQGPAAREAYIHAFDRSVRMLAERSGPITAELSGGLDSTFVVASLARVTRPGTDPLLALVASPLAAATPPGTRWVFDDEPYARLMGQRYPQAVDVQPVRNEALVQPLDAAATVARRAWWPGFGPTNLVWVDQIRDVAHRRGSRALFTGSNGNAAFSHQHVYAAAYYRQRRQWATMLRLAMPDDARAATMPKFLIERVLRPLRAGNHPPQPRKIAGLTTAAGGPATPSTSRDSYLDWLAGHRTPYPAASNPAAFPVLTVDPFRSRTVLDIAARITPAQWNSTTLSRGYARLLADGRVPDEIRLRTARGSQAGDVWYWIHRQRDRYFDEIGMLANTPAIGSVVDCGALTTAVRGWPWGEPTQPPRHGEVVTVTRILALAQFCRDAQQRLRGSASNTAT